MFYVFPNPIGNNGDLFIGSQADGMAKLKLAVVDSTGTSLFNQSLTIQEGNSNFAFPSAAFAGLERKKIHRMYYTFLDDSDDIIYQGYGDIAVCELDVNPDFDTCFD